MFYELLPTHASTWKHLHTYFLLYLALCSKNNGGCHHTCVNRPTGPLCKCSQGYVLQGRDCYGEEGMWEGRGGEGRGREGVSEARKEVHGE